MRLTPEQRELIDAVANGRPVCAPMATIRAAAAAALADLDAATAALGPVAWQLRNLPPYVFLSPSEADAVLAAAGDAN